MKINTKQIVLAALLTALGIIYTRFMYTVDLGFWSFTPFSHVPLFIGCFISPFVGIMTAIGTLIGFILKTSNVTLLLRAATHVVFVLIMTFMLKKGDFRKGWSFLFLALFIAIIHSACELLVTLCFTDVIGMLVAAFFGTMFHSMLDVYVAKLLVKVLEKSSLYIEYYDVGDKWQVTSASLFSLLLGFTSVTGAVIFALLSLFGAKFGQTEQTVFIVLAVCFAALTATYFIVKALLKRSKTSGVSSE